LVKKLKSSDERIDIPKKAPKIETLEFESLEKRLNSFGLKTKTKAHSITIEFENSESINNFLEKIK
jgi:ParB family chromosome partitioning protein